MESRIGEFMKALEEASKDFKYIKVDGNKLEIIIQDGTILESGENGMQISDLIPFISKVIEILNKDYPCYENTQTIGALNKAFCFQEKRTTDRVKRWVEGKNVR